jgi:hypothetical protein
MEFRAQCYVSKSVRWCQKQKGGRNAGLAIFDVKLRGKGKHRHMQRKALYSYILKGKKKKAL